MEWPLAVCWFTHRGLSKKSCSVEWPLAVCWFTHRGLSKKSCSTKASMFPIVGSNDLHRSSIAQHKLLKSPKKHPKYNWQWCIPVVVVAVATGSSISIVNNTRMRISFCLHDEWSAAVDDDNNNEYGGSKRLCGLRCLLLAFLFRLYPKPVRLVYCL